MLRVKIPFATAQAVYPAGTRVPEDHPVVAGREALFETIPGSEVVEQATAAPGEVRETKPRKAAARKATAKAED